MKLSFQIITSFCGLVLMAPAIEMRDATTHEQMTQRLQAQRQNDPMDALQVVEGDDPSKTNRPADLLESSDFLCFSGAATLVPKGAILHVPESMKSRVAFAPGSAIVTWSQFSAENRGWIKTVELTLEQVTGKAPLPETLVDSMEKSRQVMIATVQGGPITVPASQIEAAKAAAAAAKAN